MKDFLRILLLAMVVCCWSCSDGGGEDSPTPSPKPETGKIEISSSTPVVEQKGGTATITFTTNASWTASIGGSVSWAKVSPANGTAGTHTLIVTTEENDTYDERNATLTIKAGNASQNVTITQKQKDALTVTSNKVEISAEGGDFSIEAKANVSVSFEIEDSAKDWISAIEGRALATKTLSFTAKANEKKENRQGNIILKGGDGLTETVTVYQEGEKPVLVITSDDIVVGSEGESIKIELKSNVDYTMVLPQVDWISKEESRAVSAYTHYLAIAPNETYDQRSAVVYFQSETEDLKDSINITQLQKDAIIVAKNEYMVESAGGELDFEINTNVDFTVETSVDWIKQNTGSRGLEAKPLSFTIAENTADEPREGVITISSGDLKQNIKVVQKAKSTFSISQTEFGVPSAGGKFSVDVSTNGEYTVTLPMVDWLKEITGRATSTYNHTFSVSANNTYDAREADIAFTHKETGEVLIVKVVQAQKDAIIVAKNEYTVESAGGELDFEVNTNVDFTVETSVDWIKQNTGSRGLEAKPLSFTIAENTSDEPREGVITISSGDLKQSIKVVQKAQTAFSVSRTEFSVPSVGGEICVEVFTNGEYSVTLPKVDWLKETSSRATASYKHTFSISANETYDARETEIAFTHKETGEVLKVKVLQSQKDAIIIAKNEYTVGAAGGELSFEVNSNVDFKVNTTVNWIKQITESRGLETKRLSFMIAENTSSNSRESIITISAGELKQEIKIYQEEEVFFSVSQTEFNISSNAQTFGVQVFYTGEYTVTLPKVDWLEEIVSRAVSYHYHQFQVARNETYEGREAEIIFTHTKTGESIKVKVVQAQENVIILEKNEYEVTSFGDTITVDVKANTDFNVSIDCDWIIHTEPRSLSKNTLTFVVLKNETKDKRSAYIWLNAPSAGASIRIQQDCGVDTNGNINGMPEENWD